MIRRAHRWEDLPLPKLTPSSTSFARIKAWRDVQILAGRPSGLLDYYRAFGFCIACQASGVDPNAADWDGDIPLFQSCKVCFGSGKVQVS